MFRERREKRLLSLSGRLETGNLNVFLSEARTLLKEKAPQKIVVDLSKVEFLDSAGALGLMELEDGAKAHSIPFQLTNVTEDAKRIMGLIDRKALAMKPLLSDKQSSNVIEQIKEASLGIYNDFVSIMAFLGDHLMALVRSVGTLTLWESETAATGCYSCYE
jgi:anti-anti-sigma factor